MALLITTTAAAPSEICDADPAVMVPSLLNAGRSRPRLSVVVSARMPSSVRNSSGSPLRCGIETGTTSSSNTPSFQALAASWWLRAENASCSSRENSASPTLAASVSRPIAWSVNASHSPSKAMWSRIVTSPYLKPSRLFSSRCGALVIDSWPPATTISNSPARMSWSARAMASMPERHTLLIVSAGTVIGMPALTAAWRAGIWPAPAVRTWPMIT